MFNTGLIGKNIKYSKSPDIHNKFYIENKIPFKYSVYNLDILDIKSFIKDLHKKNIIGFNVTIPYKEEIIKYLDKTVYPANIIGAVNTVCNINGELIGYNTDYFGFRQSLVKNNINLKNKTAAIIGTGGSAKCVYTVLVDLGIKEIDIFTRDISKKKQNYFKKSKFIMLKEKYELNKYDIIINCTPLGGANFVDEEPIFLKNIKNSCVLYDLNYNPKESVFLKKGKEMNLTVINGEDMLFLQAIKSIEIWRENVFKGEVSCR